MLVDAQVSPMKTSLSGRRDDPAPSRGRSFFARDPVTGEEAPQRGDADAHAPPSQHLPQLRQRRIGLLLNCLQDEGRMVLDLGRSTITTLRLGRRRAVSEHQLPPADRARRADAEPLRRLPARHPALDSGHDTVS
jgi:hypothetical protein